MACDENNCDQVVACDEDNYDQNGKPSTPPFRLSSAYYFYYRSQLTVPAAALPPKHCFTNKVSKQQRKRATDHA